MTTAAETSSLEAALRDLDVPEDFNVYESTSDKEIIVRLDAWKLRAQNVLESLRQRLLEYPDVTAEEKVRITSKVAQFDGSGPWGTNDTRNLAAGKYSPLTVDFQVAHSEARRNPRALCR